MRSSGAGNVILQSNGKQVATFNNGGDVSFYEDTGTTAKFVWDASTESLGIGGSPATNLDVRGNVPTIRLSDTDISTSWADNKEMGRLEFWTTDGSGNAPYDTAYIAAVNGLEGGTLPSGELVFATATYNASGGAIERMRIDDDGRVGIGTASPSAKLQSVTTNNSDVAISAYETTIGGEAKIDLSVRNNGSSATPVSRVSAIMSSGTVGAEAGHLKFSTMSSGTLAERARIDSSGNLLVGQTSSTDPATDNVLGSCIRSGGLASFSRSSTNATLNLNKNYFDGSIVDFRKNGSTVGSIGVESGRPYIANASGGVAVNGSVGSFFSTNGAGNASDNTMDLGLPGSRFDDIYATNGTIQTSDRNEKQDIETLSDAEQRVAQACKGLLRKFRWKDSVSEKGDEARIHFGIIAQDLRDAFTAEGLDAGDYAMFISSTWYEKTISVDAVEAQEEVLDEDGNVVTEAVEATEAYTYVDTKDEPTDGYTERTRLGVRYPELLAFIIAAI
jgi:hypothetical protein